MKPESSPSSGPRRNQRPTRSFSAFALLHGSLAILATAAITGLAGCASTIRTPPPPGHALIDATPDLDRRDRIDGIHLVSVNGTRIRGTETTLVPGRNTVRLGFRWPQGETRKLIFECRKPAVFLRN